MNEKCVKCAEGKTYGMNLEYMLRLSVLFGVFIGCVCEHLIENRTLIEHFCLKETKKKLSYI